MSFLTNDFPSTSYYDSDLRELIKMYEFLTSEYKGLLESIEELQNLYNSIDDKIANAITPSLNELKAWVNLELVNFDNKYNQKFTLIDSNIDHLKLSIDKVTRDIELLREYVDFLNGKTKSELEKEILQITDNVWLAIFDINKRIDEIIKEYPPVTNPITYVTENLQIVLFKLYDALRVLAFTALEFDTSSIDVSVFDASNINALTFDTQGKEYFNRLKSFTMFSPVTGKNVKLSYVISDVDRNNSPFAYNANWFDSRELTSNEIDNMDLTAFELGYYGNEILKHNHDLLSLGNKVYLLNGIESTTSTNWSITLPTDKELYPLGVSAFINIDNKWSAIESVTIDSASVQNIYFEDTRVTDTSNYSYMILFKEKEN